MNAKRITGIITALTLALLFLLAAAPKAEAIIVWETLPGKAREISVGANGTVWVVGMNAVPGGNSPFRWNGRGWTAGTGGLTRIAVDPQGKPWGMNSDNTMVRGTIKIIVPNLVGQTKIQAQAALTAFGLTSSVTLQNVINQPNYEGKVVSQNPAAGQNVNPGGAVTFIVIKNVTQVPNVIGQTQSQAQATLTAAGLTSSVTIQNVVNQPNNAGKVGSQNPAAGQYVNPGGAVALSVNNNVLQVPNYSGKTVTQYVT